MIRFTVLGGTGYVGSRLAAHLKTLGHEVNAPAKDDPGIFGHRLGHVMFCIGLTADFRSRPFDTVKAHVEVLRRVLENTEFETLTYLSSTRVYMDNARTDEEAPVTACPHDPSYLYNLSKLTGECLCHSSGRKGVRVVRLSNVVGPGMDPRSGNFVASLMREAASGRIHLRSDPDSAKDYINVEDVVEWLPRIALDGGYKTYNLASGVQISHRHWANWMVRQLGGTWSSAPGSPKHMFAPVDVRRLQSEFGVCARPADEWIPN
ncbi:MAG: NAD-dependent epimerase/dehydratase family protein [Rubrivivax sp.]|jgi:nucleoside-diphosphate-sugar epimerase